MAKIQRYTQKRSKMKVCQIWIEFCATQHLIASNHQVKFRVHSNYATRFSLKRITTWLTRPVCLAHLAQNIQIGRIRSCLALHKCPKIEFTFKIREAFRTIFNAEMVVDIKRDRLHRALEHHLPAEFNSQQYNKEILLEIWILSYKMVYLTMIWTWMMWSEISRPTTIDFWQDQFHNLL